MLTRTKRIDAVPRIVDAVGFRERVVRLTTMNGVTTASVYIGGLTANNTASRTWTTTNYVSFAG